jgi:hypothetical protein
MSEQDEINKLIGQVFQRKLEDVFLGDLGKISMANGQPQPSLTAEALEDAIARLYPPPEYVFFASMISVCEIWRSLKKQGWRIKRVRKHNTLKIYSGFRFVSELHVDPWNRIPVGKMIQCKRSDFEIKIDPYIRGLK